MLFICVICFCFNAIPHSRGWFSLKPDFFCSCKKVVRARVRGRLEQPFAQKSVIYMRLLSEAIDKFNVAFPHKYFLKGSKRNFEWLQWIRQRDKCWMHVLMPVCVSNTRKTTFLYLSLTHSVCALCVYSIRYSYDASNFSNEVHLCCGLDGWLLIIWCLMDFDGFNFGLITHARAAPHNRKKAIEWTTPTAHTLIFAVEKVHHKTNGEFCASFAFCALLPTNTCTHSSIWLLREHVAKSIPNYHSLVWICRLWMNMVSVCARDRLNCKRKERKRARTLLLVSDVIDQTDLCRCMRSTLSATIEHRSHIIIHRLMGWCCHIVAILHRQVQSSRRRQLR